MFTQNKEIKVTKDDFKLKAELTIYFKDGRTQTGKFNIRGANIKDTDLNYSDIDYYDLKGDKYKYVIIENGEPRLLKVIIESEQISFYEGAPIGKGQWNRSYGVAETWNVSHFFVRKGDSEFVSEWKKFDKKKAMLPFQDCPAIIKMYNNKNTRSNTLDPHFVVTIYNNGCKEEGMEKVGDKYILNIKESIGK
jgi:hypothetical protein